MKCTIDECGKEATHTFVWPWGDPGACCQDHVLIVKQRAEHTRGEMSFVAFVPLDPDRPRPVERNERVELVSAKLVAEADAQEAKVRAEKLFDANSELTAELRRVRARADEFEARVKELLSQLELAKRAEGEALARAADIRAEAEKFGVVLGADTDAPAAGDGWPGTTAPGGMGG